MGRLSHTIAYVAGDFGEWRIPEIRPWLAWLVVRTWKKRCCCCHLACYKNYLMQQKHTWCGGNGSKIPFESRGWGKCPLENCRSWMLLEMNCKRFFLKVEMFFVYLVLLKLLDLLREATKFFLHIGRCWRHWRIWQAFRLGSLNLIWRTCHDCVMSSCSGCMCRGVDFWKYPLAKWTEWFLKQYEKKNHFLSDSTVSCSEVFVFSGDTFSLHRSQDRRDLNL